VRRLIALALLVAAPAHAQVTLRSLLGELGDLDRLSRLPRVPYVTRQASSYDRNSTTPANPRTWFANGDMGFFVRYEVNNGRGEYVLVDADGPGAIVRLWSANPQSTLRIYLDGASEPTIEAPFATLLDGGDPRFPPPLGHEAARGHSLYYPIPYAKKCKITVGATDKLYYHVDYRTYPAGTAVETWSDARARAAADDLQRAIRRLTTFDPPGGAWRRQIVQPGAPLTVDAPAGGAAIRELVVRVPNDDAAELRARLVTLRFDGEETVRAPLDALFGSGPGLNPYRTLPLEIGADGTLRSRWRMPFAHRAELALEAGAPVEVELRVEPERFGDDSLYFHARWHAPDDLPTAEPRDWNLVTVDGRGVYVGNTLDVRYFEHSWWGEGDEKIWVDGEPFPSWFGTGTEDYYGYAWCSTRKFSHPFHAQTRADGPIRDVVGSADGFGYTSVNRFHVIDAIPFQRRLQFDLEVLDWHRRSHIVLDAVAYYYARPGARDHLPPVTPAVLRIP
jgi:hypothetical protein